MLFGSTPMGRELALLVAARLETGLTAHCIDLALDEDGILEHIIPIRTEQPWYRNPFEVADEAIRWILENHQPEPLPENVRQELRKLVAAADQDEN